MIPAKRLPTFSDAFGHAAFRLAGVPGWESVAFLGRNNLHRLQALAQTTGARLLAEGAPRTELRRHQAVTDLLADAERSCRDTRPFLPRLRAELFRGGDRVAVYLGELPGATCRWVTGQVVSVTKSFNVEWKNAATHGGYYWRVTVEPDSDSGSPLRSLSFSTTEPRVLPVAELAELVRLAEEDDPFVAMFCANAAREWMPLWCLEHGIDLDTSAMSYGAWISQAREQTLAFAHAWSR